MFDNDDDQKFYLAELERVQKKSEQRKAAFKSMVDHFFKSEAEKEREAQRTPLNAQQSNPLGHQGTAAAPSLQRSGFGLHGEKNKTSLAHSPSAANAAPGEIHIPGPLEQSGITKSPQSVTSKFGVTSRLGRFR